MYGLLLEESKKREFSLRHKRDEFSLLIVRISCFFIDVIYPLLGFSASIYVLHLRGLLGLISDGVLVSYAIIFWVPWFAVQGCLAFSGRSIGRVVFGLRLLDLNGLPIHWGRAVILRCLFPWLVYLVPFAGWSAALFDLYMLLFRGKRWPDHLLGADVNYFPLAGSSQRLVAGFGVTSVALIALIPMFAWSFGPPPRAALDWMKSRTTSLTTIHPFDGFKDFQPVKSLIGNAQVVALGESTHGTREFFIFRHRLLKFLVEEMGFSVFACEASMVGAVSVNDFIAKGVSEPGHALEALNTWVWQTEESLMMIKWMRDYNKDSTHKRKIKFYGYDVPASPIPVVAMLAQEVKPIDPAANAELISMIGLFERCESTGNGHFVNEKDKHKLETAKIQIAKIITRLENKRSSIISVIGVEAFVRHQQCLRLLMQCVEMRLDGWPFYGNTIREKAMAENINWIQNQAKGEKIVIWGHNAHVRFTKRSLSAYDSFGYSLKRALGNNLIVIGFLFGKGGFQADGELTILGNRLKAFNLPMAPSGSFEDGLSRIGQDLIMVDLRKSDNKQPPRWLSIDRPVRNIGGAYWGAGGRWEGFQLWNPLDSFDAIIFFQSTHRAIPL